MSGSRILIVEDERIVARDLRDSLEGLGYEVVDIVSTGERAIESVGENSPDLVVMDIILKGEIDGVVASKTIREKYDIPVIYLTAHTDVKTVERVKDTEPYGYVVKPFRIGELRSVIEIAIHKHRRESVFREESESISSVLSVIGSGIVTVDVYGRVRYMNRKAEELTGRKRSDVAGSSVGEVIKLSDVEAGIVGIVDTVVGKGGNTGRYEDMEMELPGGIRKMVDIDVIRLDGEGGEVRGAAVIVTEPGVGGVMNHERGEVKLALVGTPLVREGIKSVVGDREGLEVVAETGEDFRVSEMVSCSGADVMIIDGAAYGDSLYEFLNSVTTGNPDMKIILIVHDVDETFIKQCTNRGISGFVSTISDPEDIVKASYTVMKNGIWLDRSLFERILTEYTGPGTSYKVRSALTKRESEILDMIRKGMTNKQITDSLGLSLNTVKNHIRNIYEKLHVHSRYEIISSRKFDKKWGSGDEWIKDTDSGG